MASDEIKRKIILDGKSTSEDYKILYNLEVGDVFKVKDSYEQVMEYIQHYCPTDMAFEVFPINPGTSLFTMYGPDHCIVTKKEIHK